MTAGIPRFSAHMQRVSSSSSGSMSSSSADDVEFPVWLGGCQKWVTGLTKRTTCDDVIYALLAHENNPNNVIDVQCFALFERWRGVERPLRGRTKIVKIWRAWGAERDNVKFSVRKVLDSLDSSSEVSRGKRTKRHHPAWRERDRKERCERCRRGLDCPKHRQSTSTDSKPHKEDKYKAKAYHELVQQILDQEKTIQEQMSRIRDTDAKIESYETKVHLARMQENGENYVQDAYLREKDSDSSGSGDDLFPAIKANDLETYAHICDNILDLEERITNEHSRILDLSVRVQEESMLVLPPELPKAGSRDLLAEIESLRMEIHRSLAVNDSKRQQSILVNDTLRNFEWQLQRKQGLMHSLVAELNDLQQEEDRDTEDVHDLTPNSTPDSIDSGTYNEMPVDCDFAFTNGRESPSPPPIPPPPQFFYDYLPYNLHPNSRSEPHGLPSIPEHPQPPPKPPRLNISPPAGEITQLSMTSSNLPFYVTKVSSYKDYQWGNKNNSDNDSNSDTGLSSLHSDESPPILETLV